MGFRTYYEYLRLPKDPNYRALLAQYMQLTGATYKEARRLDSPVNARIANVGAGRMASRLGIEDTGPILGENMTPEQLTEWRAMFGDTPPA